MRTQAQVEQLFRSLYQNLGKEPTDLIQERAIRVRLDFLRVRGLGDAWL